MDEDAWDAWLAQVQRAEARDRELEGATEGGEAMFLDRPGLDPAPVQPAPLHLIRGRWVASCPRCGCELASGWRQDRVERKAARRSCPVCVEVA